MSCTNVNFLVLVIVLWSGKMVKLGKPVSLHHLKENHQTGFISFTQKDIKGALAFLQCSNFSVSLNIS